MFLRSRARWRTTLGLWILGIALCVVSVLGLTGAFGEISSAGRFGTIVLFGVPLGLLSIGCGIANGIRGWSDPGDEEVDEPVHAGDRAGLSDAEATEADATDRDRHGPGGSTDR
ncbi:hypothetical protein [Clavibacter capsici]|uniref:Uncharacterized protein n=1 Tax=Clavibacter capsici TaxID=1874630 RepID=A0A0M4H1H2_9MICO|nr:hypothetical protein [Clavibacter capsici]ALD13474.1 hypothetical protein AES38_11580 [Clavibacter capsici]QIS39819.1 hypothetical protein GW572_12015 [Clavibacter capsici]QIS42733.1 hypothetical protein GW571_11595 [Clavibacter capsici]QIS45678.1 hypothetical protein GW570_11565 [Clavibacter capsici]